MLTCLNAKVMTGPYRNFDLVINVLGDLVGPEHGKAGWYHFAAGRKIQPNLKESGGVVLGLVEQGKHFAVHNAFAGSHPLDITATIPSGVPGRIRVIDQSINRGGNGFKTTVRMLWKTSPNANQKKKKQLEQASKTVKCAAVVIHTLTQVPSLHDTCDKARKIKSVSNETSKEHLSPFADCLTAKGSK